MEDQLKEDEFTVGESLEVVSRLINNVVFKGKFVSYDSNYNSVTLELNNGTRVLFKKDNIQKVVRK